MNVVRSALSAALVILVLPALSAENDPATRERVTARLREVIPILTVFTPSDDVHVLRPHPPSPCPAYQSSRDDQEEVPGTILTYQTVDSSNGPGVLEVSLWRVQFQKECYLGLGCSSVPLSSVPEEFSKLTGNLYEDVMSQIKNTSYREAREQGWHKEIPLDMDASWTWFSKVREYLAVRYHPLRPTWDSLGRLNHPYRLKNFYVFNKTVHVLTPLVHLVSIPEPGGLLHALMDTKSAISGVFLLDKPLAKVISFTSKSATLVLSLDQPTASGLNCIGIQDGAMIFEDQHGIVFSVVKTQGDLPWVAKGSRLTEAVLSSGCSVETKGLYRRRRAAARELWVAPKFWNPFSIVERALDRWRRHQPIMVDSLPVGKGARTKRDIAFSTASHPAEIGDDTQMTRTYLAWQQGQLQWYLQSENNLTLSVILEASQKECQARNALLDIGLSLLSLTEAIYLRAFLGHARFQSHYSNGVVHYQLGTSVKEFSLLDTRWCNNMMGINYTLRGSNSAQGWLENFSGFIRPMEVCKEDTEPVIPEYRRDFLIPTLGNGSYHVMQNTLVVDWKYPKVTPLKVSFATPYHTVDHDTVFSQVVPSNIPGIAQIRGGTLLGQSMDYPTYMSTIGRTITIIIALLVLLVAMKVWSTILCHDSGPSYSRTAAF